MDQSLLIECERVRGLELRSIRPDDLENLRNWKNNNRHSFFHTDIIAPAQQETWFRNYLGRSGDHMFIVYSGEDAIGCMGFRQLEQEIDIYNIIRGNEKGEKGLMSIALLTMCNYAWQNSGMDITVKVLKTNPAADWYKKKGFREISPQNDYFYYKLNPEEFRTYTFKKR